MIDFELYRIFVAVANEENITKASDKLNISQPAITKQIKNLENGKIFSLDTNSYTLKQLDLIIKYVRQKGYDFVTLEEILNEKINDKY